MRFGPPKCEASSNGEEHRAFGRRKSERPRRYRLQRLLISGRFQYQRKCRFAFFGSEQQRRLKECISKNTKSTKSICFSCPLWPSWIQSCSFRKKTSMQTE